MHTILSIIKTIFFSLLVVSLSTPLYLLTFSLLALKTIYTLVFNTFQIGVKSIAFLCNRIDNSIESLTVYLFNQKYIFLLALPAKILHLAANIIFIPVFTISKALDRLPSLIEYPHLVYIFHNIAIDFFQNNDQKKFVETYLTFRSVNDIETFLDTKIIDDNSIDDDVDINEHFKTLGLDAQSADHEAVNKAYKKSSLENHPDKGGDQETQKKINAAKECLENFFRKNTESSNETTKSRDLNLNQYFLYAMSLLIKIDQFNIFLEKNFQSLLSSLQIHMQRFNTNSLHNKVNHWKETFKNKTSSFFEYFDNIILKYLSKYSSNTFVVLIIYQIALQIEGTLMDGFILSSLWLNVYIIIFIFIGCFGYAAYINDYYFERKIHIGEIMTVISVMPIISFIILSSFISKLGELIFEILAIPLTALNLIYNFFVPSSSEDPLANNLSTSNNIPIQSSCLQNTAKNEFNSPTNSEASTNKNIDSSQMNEDPVGRFDASKLHERPTNPYPAPAA